MTNYLTREQIEQILRPINPTRVSSREGLAYVEAYEVRAHMARVFGIARWSSEVIEQHMICEDAVQTKAGKPAWYVAYRSIVRVTVCAPDGTQLAVYTEGHAGDSTHPVKGEAHGNAITNSESYAFKRAACMALLDQGGLSLYGKGSKAALVKRTLVMPGETTAAEEPVDHDAGPVAAETDTDARPDPEPTPAPTISPSPAAVPPVPTPAGNEADGSAPSPDAAVDALRERVIEAMHLPKKDAIIAFGKLNLEVAKARLQQAPTTTPGGSPTTLGNLIDQALQHVSRPERTAHGVHDDEAGREDVA